MFSQTKGYKIWNRIITVMDISFIRHIFDIIIFVSMANLVESDINVKHN